MNNPQKQQKRNKTGLILLVLTAVVLMAASIILVVRFPQEDQWKEPAESDINNPASSGFLCDAVEAQKLYPLGNGLVKISGERVSYLDLQGNEKFGQAVDLSAPFCRISGGRALVADTNGFQYLVLDSKGILYSGIAEAAVDYGSINPDGYVALIMDKPGIKGLTTILKPDGSTLFSWQSAESGYILSAHINSDSSLVDITLANTDGSALQPVLKRFGIDGTAEGQFLPDVHQLLPSLYYDTEGDPVSCGISELIAFDGTNEKYRLAFSKIYTAASSDQGILVVAKKQSGDVPALYCIKNDGSLSGGIPLSEEVTPIAVKGQLAAVGSGNAVVCVNLGTMKEKSRTPISASSIRVGFAASNSQIISIARDGVTVCNP